MAAKKGKATKPRKRSPSKARKEKLWKPLGTTFEAGEPYFRSSLRKVGLDPEAQVFTSKHEAAKAVQKYFRVQSAPPGFKKWQLPFALHEPTNFYITEGRPNATVDAHSHEHGAGFRVIIKGSLVLEGVKLGAGDWFYVPQGKPYSYKVGRTGVQLMSGYQCCCEPWPCC